MPSFSGNVVLYIVISVVVLGFIGLAFYWLFSRSRYNLTFVIWRDVYGIPTITDRVKGMRLKPNPKSLTEVFFVKKFNKYVPIGNIQTAKNTFWYYIDSAGHWHNVGVNFIDVGKREVQLNMQLQMDYAKDGINKGLEERHSKPNWWDKWGMVTVSIVVIAVLLVFVWLAFRDALQNNQTSQANAQAIAKIQDDLTTKYTNLLVAMENVCQGNRNYVTQYLNATNASLGALYA